MESVPPGAPVLLDGRPTDQRTPAKFQLPEGEHEVGVEVDGQVRSEKVAVADNGLIKVQY